MSFFWHLKLALLRVAACLQQWFHDMVFEYGLIYVRKSLRSQSSDWHWDGMIFHSKILLKPKLSKMEMELESNRFAVPLHLHGHCQQYTNKWKPPRRQIQLSFILQQPFSCSNQNMREPWSEFPPNLEDVNSGKQSLQKSFPHGPDASVYAN